ncbi:hypothetical protein [Haloglycomyces albus]|uniref:hypothetical protein n=1 Tax=Haloglycomyces albus TaxID=526067 RepID=UPI00046C99DB|nr:hypothetical protein [Haloglycomyces albus]
MVTTATIPSDTVASWQGHEYDARLLADGAAYELFTPYPAEGFTPYERCFHRYVHGTEVIQPDEPYVAYPDVPLSLPIHSHTDSVTLQNLTQKVNLTAPERDLVRNVRSTARVRRGTRMMKPMSAAQVSRQLNSAATVSGICFREFDTAHLRLPEQRQALAGDPDIGATISYALRWNAVSETDYVPTDVTTFPGLPGLRSRERRGALIVGTGFLPSPTELVPEFATADFAEIPLTSGAEIVAYTGQGEEVPLFQYQATSGTWERMAGSQWRRLLGGIPGNTGNRTRFFVEPNPWSGLVAVHEGRQVAAIADLGFGRNRFDNDVFVTFLPGNTTPTTVAAPQRFYVKATWKGVDCVVVDNRDEWLRLRLVQPNMNDFAQLNVNAVERGVYERWAHSGEVVDRHAVAIYYCPCLA